MDKGKKNFQSLAIRIGAYLSINTTINWPAEMSQIVMDINDKLIFLPPILKLKSGVRVRIHKLPLVGVSWRRTSQVVHIRVLKRKKVNKKQVTEDEIYLLEKFIRAIPSIKTKKVTVPPEKVTVPTNKIA